MNRRQALLTLIVSGLSLTGARGSSAQSAPKTALIGLLDAGQRLEWWAAFRQQLRDLGYIEGQTVAIESRFAGGQFEQLPALAEELVRLKVAVIVTGGSVAAQAAKRATSTIPIVMATGGEPMPLGLAQSLSRPGGNVTGVTSLSADLTGKRLEVVKEVVPKISRLAVLWHRDNPASSLGVRELETAARSSRVALQMLGVKTSDEFARAFSAMTQKRAQAIYVVAGPSFFSERQRLAGLAMKHRLPSMYTQPEYVEAGGLLSYGPSYSDLFRRAAVYVDKILKGARPADLPIEQPTRFDLVINLKTARALGMTVPRSILLRADRAIE